MSLGDEEHPISVLFEADVQGDHVHVTVRASQRGMRALAGKFTVRCDEWAVLRDNLGYSEPVDDKLAVSYRYAPPGATSHLAGIRIVHFDASPIEITEGRVPERDTELFARLDDVRREIEESAR